MNKKTILIVDDSQFDRVILSSALSRRIGFEVIEAKSAEECLDILAARKVDLILLDIIMPGALGSQVLLQIRAHHNPINLPIIMVTAKNESEDIIECLQNGANDYVTKPVDFEVVVSRVITHLTLADVSREMGRLRELEALNAMIATYNHEINNPLAIALGCVDSALPGNLEAKREKLGAALLRIKEIVRKIQDVSDSVSSPEYEDYSHGAKMVKVR